VTLSFEFDVAKMCKDAEADLDLVVRKTLIDITTRVIERTPVDTGRLRGNWQIGIGTEPHGELDVEGPGMASATISDITGELSKAQIDDAIFFVNNLPYASVVEAGSSKQSPAGMLEVTLREFGVIVDKNVREAGGS
jgi:hypothetical protein